MNNPDLDFVPVDEPGSFIGHLGGLHWRIGDGTAATSLIIAPHHANPNGSAHGGVLLTMLDITLGATAKAALGATVEAHPITMQLSSSFVGAARIGDRVEGEAQVDRQTRSTTFVSGRLHVAGATVATAAGVFRNPSPERRP